MDDLFAPVKPDEAQSEHIDAPEYSYWGSVFRVFFRKKLNIFFLAFFSINLPIKITVNNIAHVSKYNMCEE